MLVALLLVLLLCGYVLAKQARNNWRDNAQYRRVDAVVTANVRYTWDRSETEPLWKGDARHPLVTEWCITLEAEGKAYCVRTTHPLALLYREGKHTALYLPETDSLCPQLAFQRGGAGKFAAAVLLCIASAGGIVWYAVRVLTMQ